MCKIRPADINDLDCIISINQELENYGWPDGYFANLLANETPIWLAEDINGNVCGFIVVSFLSSDIKILNLTIARAFQKQGIGRQLLNHALQAAKQYGVWFAMLEVRINNSNAIKLYQNLGFKILCVREEYYTHLQIQDAYLMQLDLRKYAAATEYKTADLLAS